MDEHRVKSKEAPESGIRGKAGNLYASFKKLDTKKKIQYVGILLLVIIILTIYFSSFKSAPGENAPSEPSKTSSETVSLETQLDEILSRIEGAGEVHTMITYESGPEIVPALSVDKQTSSTTDTGENGTSMTNTENTQSNVVTVNGSNGASALVLREDSPKILGVIVVAEGADNISVRLNLLEAVETVLNVSPDKVDVYKMNNE